MKFGLSVSVSAHERSSLSPNNLCSGHQTHWKPTQRRWRTTIRASCMSANSISCWFTEIPKMLHMQGIFSSNNFKLGLLNLPWGMVLYWEAFGACTSCVLLGEWSHIFDWLKVSHLVQAIHSGSLTQCYQQAACSLILGQVALQKYLCYSRSRDIPDQTPAARWATIRQDECHSNLPSIKYNKASSLFTGWSFWCLLSHPPPIWKLWLRTAIPAVLKSKSRLFWFTAIASLHPLPVGRKCD